MAGGRTYMFLHGLGTLLVFISAITLMIAVFTDSWLVSSVSEAGFDKAGLWKVCFGRFVADRQSVSLKILNGCYSYVDPGLGDIQDWIHPVWLKLSKGFLATAIFLNVFTLFSSASYVVLRHNAVLVLILVLSWLSALLVSAGTTLFRFGSDDRSWLPLPESNQMSHSYYTSVATIFLMTFAATCYAIQAGVMYCNRARSMSKY